MICTRKFAPFFLASMMMVLFATSVADAQERGGDRRGGDRHGGDRRGGMFFGGNSKLELLGRDDVKKELEVVEEQEEKLAEIRDEMRSRMREMFSGLRGLNEQERREMFGSIREKMGTVVSEMEGKVDGILLPNQVERLNQISFQSRTRRSRNAGLDNDEVVTKLGITKEQKEELQEVAAKAQEKLRENIRKLQAETQKEILSVLTPEQREKYQKMSGKPFERSDEGRRWRRDR